MRYSIIIPTYNEEGTVVLLYHSIREVMSKLNESYEIIFVDDGSTDSSLQKLKGIQVTSHGLVIIVLRKRVGKSEALQAGFDYAVGEIYVTLDADGQNDPCDIPSLLNKMEEGYDVVYGYRYRMHSSFRKKLASKIANIVNRLITKINIHDIGCALRVFRKKDIEHVCLSRGLHRFFSTIMIRLGYRVGEIKVNHYPRISGVSQYGILNRLKEVLIDCFRLIFIDIDILMKHKRQYQIQEIIRNLP